MASSLAFILALSLASQSLAYPVAPAGLKPRYDDGFYHTTGTWDDGFYHWKPTTAAAGSVATSAPVEQPAPAPTAAAPVVSVASVDLSPVPAATTVAPIPTPHKKPHFEPTPTQAPEPTSAQEDPSEPTIIQDPPVEEPSSVPAPTSAQEDPSEPTIIQDPPVEEPSSVPAPPPAPTSAPAPTKPAPSKPASEPSKPSPPAPTTAPSSSPETGNVSPSKVSYKKFTGDGSSGSGWPTMNQWASFEQMWANNKPVMAASCASQGVENNTEEEMAQMKAAILEQASATKVDARFILATIMEESTGCVRVKTTASPGDAVINPGLMQDHEGTGSCAGIKAPCPEAQIKQMIQDGTAGTAAGDGLKQTLAKAGAYGSDATAVYVAARIYNSGSYRSGALELNAATSCYASDIANLLRGWAGPASPCKLGTA